MKHLFLFLLLFSFMGTMISQSNLSFHYAHAVPLGDYADHLEHNASGISFEYMQGVGQSNKLQVGALVNVAMYQNEDYEGDVALSSFRRGYVETNEDDCYYVYQGLIRYVLTKEQSLFKPYIQAQAGGTSFFSTLSIHEDTESNFEGSTQNHGTTWLVGASGGVLVKMCEQLFIDFSFGYNKSGLVAYRSSPEMNEIAQYRIDLKDHMVKSRVDHLTFKLGINMPFY